jgi:hypothetical protein
VGVCVLFVCVCVVCVCVWGCVCAVCKFGVVLLCCVGIRRVGESHRLIRVDIIVRLLEGGKER